MRCYKLLIILSVSLLFLWIDAFGCDIVLKKSAYVSGSDIELKDIASVYPKKLSHFVLGAAPYLNNSLTFSRLYIKSLLLQKKMHYTICGAKEIKITNKGYILDKAKIFSILGIKNGSLIMRKPIILPFDKHYSFSFKLKRREGNLTFYDIDVFKNGIFFKLIPVSVKISGGYVLAPVASHDISRGKRITLSDIIFKKVKHLPPNSILSKSVIVGRVTISFIKSGTPFTQFNTKQFKPVKMGDIVNVKVVEGNIVIYTVAKALRGGYNGDIIPVMYLSSNKVMPAKIVGNKLVVIQ